MKNLRRYIRYIIAESQNQGRVQKILFLGGLPGGGKSTVVENLGLDALFTICNLDPHYEAGLKRSGIPLDIQTWMSEYSGLKEKAGDPDYVMSTVESKRFHQLKGWASQNGKIMAREARPLLASDIERALAAGENVIIDGTSASANKILNQMDGYESQGYDCGMIMVDISEEFAQERNSSRGKKGGRSLPRGIIWRTSKSLQVSRVKYQESLDPYWEISNHGTFEEFIEKIAELRTEILEWVHS